MKKYCLTEPAFTPEVTIKLRNFGRMQRELERELLGAQPLGICKITTSPEGRQNFRSLDSMLRSGNVTMKIDIILTSANRKETG